RKKIELQPSATQTEKIRIGRVAARRRRDVVRADARRKETARGVRRRSRVVEIPNELRLQKERRLEPIDPWRRLGVLALFFFELREAMLERTQTRHLLHVLAWHRRPRVLVSDARRGDVGARGRNGLVPWRRRGRRELL